MQFSRVFSLQPHGLHGHLVAIETDISRGLHSFSVIGLTSKAVDEAKDRISSAIKNSGYPSPKSVNQKIVMALAPAELKKEGSYFDIAMAIGYLLSSGTIDATTHQTVFLGELALNGEVQPIKGTLPLIKAAYEHGFTQAIVPYANKDEALLIDSIAIYPVKTLQEVIDHLTGTRLIPQATASNNTSRKPPLLVPDFCDIRGQALGKRGLEIAAAGGHNVVLYGPPGTGKTSLARALIGILPELTHQEALEVTSIHSIAGTLGAEPLVTIPPFRAPHHTASHIAIIGGGSVVRPGEVTLAHRGVLFLDEFPEFDKKVIESLRQPIEDRSVSIVRANSRATFPTHFMLVAAMNPPDAHASLAETDRYRKKLSGAIMDRIDLWLPIERIAYEKLADTQTEETTATIKARVAAARQQQYERFKDTTITTNSSMTIADMHMITLAPSCTAILASSAETLKLSPRAYHRIIKLARTIADLDGAQEIGDDHILEALQYRQSLPWE